MSLLKGKNTGEIVSFTLFILLAGLTGLYIPVLYMAAALAAPICLALLVRRISLGSGIAVAAVAGLLLLPFAGPLFVISFLVQTVPLGLLLGLLFKNHVGAGRSIAAAVCVAVAADLLVGLALPAAAGSNPLAFSVEQRQASITMAENFFADRSGVMSPEDFAGLMEKNWPVFYTVSLVFTSMLSAYFVYILTRLAMIRTGYGVSKMTPFRYFRVPWYAIWGLIAGLALMLAGGVDAGSMAVAGKTVLFISCLVFFLVGLSVMIFFMQRWRIILPLKLLIVFIMVIYSFFTAMLLVGAGVLDALANLRRLTPGGELPKEDVK